MKTISVLALLMASLAVGAAAAIVDYQMNDAPGTLQQDLAQTGTDSGHLPGSDVFITTDGTGDLVWSEVTSDTTRKHSLDMAYATGSYVLEYRLSDWNMDASPNTSGVKIGVWTGSDGLGLNVDKNDSNSGLRLRATAAGGDSKQVILNWVAPEGMTARLEIDLDAGTYDMLYKFDSDGSWTTAQAGLLLGTMAAGFNEFRIATEGSTAWDPSDYVNLDYAILWADGGGNTPPSFNDDPVVKGDAFVDIAYSGSLADAAFDPDGDPLRFEKLGGPAWLNVATNGALTGTPSVGALGMNSFGVQVADDNGGTNTAILEIMVHAQMPTPVSPQEGTNVLFIAIDDMKPLLGCYGDTQALTPNIDSLASIGVTFLNAHCQWPVCGPSRASLMTGLYPEETGVMGFKKMRGDADDASRINNVIRPNVVTIPQYFRYNGYRTAATGKINDPRCVGTLNTLTGKVAEDGRDVDDPPSWGEPVDPNSLPSDFFSLSSFVSAPPGYAPPGNPSTAATNLPDAAFTDGIICDEGIGLLQALATNDTQFFLGVGFKKPHLPFVAPQAYWDYYERSDFSIHPFQDHPLHEVPYPWNYAAELAGYDDIVDETNLPESKQLELIHGYYACASFIDAQVGRLLDELESLGLHTNTIVVLWGDHGFHLGDHAEWAKHTNLEQATRVPLIVYSPFTGVAGATARSPVNFVDLYPTLCDLVGLPIPEQPLSEHESPTAPASGRNLKGKSLVPLMQDPEASVRVGALSLFQRSGAIGYAYRTDRYRYTEWVSTSANTVVARELYDYEMDPMETVNRAGEPGFDALMYQYSASMRTEMDSLKQSAGDIACPELQGSPVHTTTTGHLYLAGLKLVADGGNMSLSWPRAADWTYDVMFSTNLNEVTWQLQAGGVTSNSIAIPTNKDVSFYHVDLVE